MAVEKKVLVVDDEESMRHMLTEMLGQEGYLVETATNGVEAMEKANSEEFDFILADIRMPRMDGTTLLDELRKKGIPATVILMSAYGDVNTALEAIKRGAYDYIPKPFRADEIVLTLRKAEEHFRLLRENALLRSEIKREYSFEGFITNDPAMQEVMRTAQKMAQYKSTVLIVGESGTGKELVAKAVHLASPRAGGNFVAINCGAIPENLLESELFGHTKGAFTDAYRPKKGLFEEADGGTIFLDEVGELPLMLQVKLLRALQEEEIRRVGDTKPIKIDVRIIAATVRDLENDVQEGKFRGDLFYRLNVLPIHLPPLCERKGDIPLLVDYFLKRWAERLKKPVVTADKEAMDKLISYRWPGNVRELENVIERAIVLAESDRITVQDLPPTIRHGGEASVGDIERDDVISIKKASRALEERLIRRALDQTAGNRTQAAKLLEISHRALLYKIKEYNI